MANDGSQSARGGGGGRRCCCGALTRVDLLVFLLAAALCSASYCLGVWHNSRGAADSRVLAPSAGANTYCGDDAREPLDFETRHAAEDAGLSAPTTTAAAAGTTSTRRALRGAADGGVRVRLTGAVAVRA
ncbi:uncharacterized protein LOC100274638 [Zea mays]|uniref:Uncharacterized protein n=1 Tax=Zea mays TaxID=4577 RepID=B6SGQ3_MAIZE|nr:uncharacterized protein LOC100274638 [Zea mays]ACG24036.1 hypothetical protein [Zea mays]ONL99339.1 hypothetical protein ZEAMMB73_Zm00001d029669 [Zea mays]|eukprot:NP_001142447.1 uncharacterized protein LOC100274638 [Zea mays]